VTRLLLALAVLTFPATAQAADPRMWQTPSKNIACANFGPDLRCDMRELGNAPAKRPKSCEFDYGQSFGVRKNGNKGFRRCVSDAVGGPGTPTIAYGRTWKRGGFTCTVKETGVRCTNAKGHGFELRRGRQRLF
jgi:hypothetical protein